MNQQSNAAQEMPRSSIPFRTEAERQRQAAETISTLLIWLSGAASAIFLLAYLYQQNWQEVAIGAAFAMCAVSGLAAKRWLYSTGKYFAGMLLLSFTLGISVTACAALIHGLGFPAAIVFLLFTMLLSSAVARSWQSTLLIAHGIIVAADSALLTDFSPFLKVQSHLVSLLTPAVLGILLMIYIVMIAMQYVTSPLRIRLLTAFIALVVLPLSGLSIVQTRYTTNLVRSELQDTLQQTAKQTAAGIDAFLIDLQNSVNQPARLEAFVQYLQMEPDQRRDSVQEREAWLALRTLAMKDANPHIELTSFALLDLDGNVLYDTLYDRWLTLDIATLGSMGIDLVNPYEDRLANEGSQDYFLIPARSGVSYLSPLQIPQIRQSFLYASAPVKDHQGRTLGVLRLRMDGYRLQSTLRQFDALLGSDTHAILLDEYNIRLADTYITPNRLKIVTPPTQETLDILIANHRLPNLPVTYLSTGMPAFDEALHQFDRIPAITLAMDPVGEHNDLPEIGAVTRLSTMPWKVVYLQENFSDSALREEQRKLNTLVTTLIAALVAMVSIVAAHILSNPIIQLTHTAQQITGGNLQAQAVEQNSDEFGMLGIAFNSMTRQMRAFINELEDRVRTRTEEIQTRNQQLARRAQQLQTVSDVARQIVSAQELQPLLSTLTELISERFGFYHVGIFLLDDNKEFAVLRAANSQGGQAMLARRHKLAVGKVGIVGYVTATGEARIASDVGVDAVHFQNPDLPETRAEMALPLRYGDEIIGAMDIQSTISDAFQPEDIALFATLADQVAVAIHNNQLFTETLRALQETEQMHRQYLRQEWSRDTAQRKTHGYVYTPGSTVVQHDENPLWSKVFATGEPIYAALPGSVPLPGSGTNGGTASASALMAVPITVRGETIGVIHVQDQGEERMWSEDEIVVVNDIAGQVAVALENARLFETTVRRAEREKKVLQITDKIRSTNDADEMMKIAVHELQTALHASRAQIYIRQDGEEASSGHPNGSNGRNGTAHDTSNAAG